MLLVSLLLWTVAAEARIEELLGSVEGAGGQFRVDVAQSAVDAGRGLVALEDIKAGEVILRLPANQALFIGSSNDTAPEMAVSLLREKYRIVRNWFDIYVTNLPELSDMLIAEMLPEDVLPLLQSSDLENIVRHKTHWARDVWSGKAPVTFPLRRAVTRHKVTWEDFLWATAVVTTRAIGLDNGRRYLIPVLDMANHHPEANHTLKYGIVDGVMTFELVAGRDVKAAEEVFISYGPLRNDEALLYYGFLLPTDPPELCAMDCKGFDPNQQPGKNSFELITAPPEAVRAEHARLKSIQDSLPSQGSMACEAEEGSDSTTGSCGSENNALASLLWRFSQIRRAAIVYEMKRLEALLHAEQR